MNQTTLKMMEKNYRRLQELGFLADQKYKKLINPPYMPLSLEFISTDDLILPGCPVLAMAHYYEMNGDLIGDPEMEIIIDHDHKRALARYWRTCHFPHRVVYQRREGRILYSPSEEKGQNEFLAMWLRNIKEQGFKPEQAEKKVAA